MIKRLLSFIIIIVLSCSESSNDSPDCSAVLCAAPSIFTNLIDNSTKENIIIQNNLTEENIVVRDASKQNIEYAIIEETGLLIISKKDLKGSIEIEIDSKIITEFSYDTSAPKTNNCCDFGELTEIIVTDKPFNLESNTITIFL